MAGGVYSLFGGTFLLLGLRHSVIVLNYGGGLFIHFNEFKKHKASDGASSPLFFSCFIMKLNKSCIKLFYRNKLYTLLGTPILE